MATLSLAALPRLRFAVKLGMALLSHFRQGRKLYVLPDDQGVIDARRSLAPDPKSVERGVEQSLIMFCPLVMDM